MPGVHDLPRQLHPHKSVPERVLNLSQRAGMGLTFLGILREVATITPAVRAMTQWWPDRDKPPPSIFSRHITTHHLTTRGQVTRVHALIAVMLTGRDPF